MSRPTYTDTLIANNAALDTMNNILVRMERQFKTLNSVQKTTVKTQNEINKATEEGNEYLETREKVLNKAMKQQKAFEIISIKSFSAYRDAGGNAFEFLDLALSSVKQQVKLFGVEAALVRKIMYGFLPPGMFRAVNKLSTGFRFMGGFLRKIGTDGGEANNIFTTMAKGIKKIPNIKSKFELIGKESRTKGIAKRQQAADEVGGVFGGLFPEDAERKSKLQSEADKFKSQAEAEPRYKKVLPAIRNAPAAINTKIQKTLAVLELIYLKSKVKALAMERRLITAANIFLSMSIKEKGKAVVEGFIKLIKTPVMQFLITGMMYLTGIALVVVLLRKTVWPAIKDAFKVFKDNLGILLAGLSNIWGGVKDVFMGLINGDLLQMLDGIFTIAWGLIQVALGILWATASGLFTLAWKTIENLFNGAIQFISDTFTSVKGFKENFGKLALVIVAAVAFFFGLPAALTVLGVVIIMAGVKWIWKKIKGIGLFASGGMANNGMAIVGEKGPELVSLPRGSRVHSNSNSKRMGGGGVVNNINITVNAKDTSKAEMKRIADELGKTITKQITRTVSKGIFR